MSAYQMIQQTRWPLEKQLSTVVSFALLQPYLTCDFANYVQALASDVPQGMATLITAFQQNNTPQDFQLQVLSGFLEARAHGFEVPAGDFIVRALEILQPEPAASPEPTFVSTNPFVTPPPVYGYGAPCAAPMTATSPIPPV